MTGSGPDVRPFIRSNRAQWTVAGVLLLIFVVFAWLQRVPSLTTANDDASYVLLSRSLREGGYNSIHLVNAPIHTKYPPAFPALLAIESTVAGESIDVFVAVNIALVATALALMFAAGKSIAHADMALGALAMAALNPPLQGIAGTVMSEPTFLALTVLTLWLLMRTPRTTRSIALACVCATLAALTRTVGATLVLAVILLLVLERRWRAAAVYGGIVVAAVIVAALVLRAGAMPALAADYVTDALDTGGAVGANPLTVIGRRIVTNGPQYAGSLLWLMSFPTIGGTVVDNFLWLAVACIALGVGLIAFWREWRIAALFALIYGVLILAWPWTIGRFLLPLLPLIAMALLLGAYALVSKWNPRAAGLVVLALVLATTATGVARSVERASIRQACDRERPMRSSSCFNADQLSFFEAAVFAAARTPPSAVFISGNEATFHYLSGRRLVAIDSINARAPEQAADFLRQSGVSYVVLGHASFAELELAERLTSACRWLQPVQGFPPRTTLFRVAQTPLSDPRACEILRAYVADAGDFRPQIF